MAGIGVVLFGKSLIVTLWASAVESWHSFRKKRAENGLPLRQGKDGVYRPHDWTQWVETAVRFIGRMLVVFWVIELIVLAGIFIYLKTRH